MLRMLFNGEPWRSLPRHPSTGVRGRRLSSTCRCWYPNCITTRMDPSSLRLELVPLDGAAPAKRSTTDSHGDSLTTTQPRQRPILEPTPSLALAPADKPAANADEAASPPKSGLALEPVDEPAAKASPPDQPRKGSIESSFDTIEVQPVDRPAPKLSGSGSADAFVAMASREYAQGQLDKPLWDRAMRQCDGDAAAAAAMYLPARAVALRILDRQRREAKRQTPEPKRDDPPASENRALALWKEHKVAIGAAVALASMALAAVMFMSMRSDDPRAVHVVARAKAPARPASAQEPQAPKSTVSLPATDPQVSAALSKKVNDLRDAGNFNVMVLYAVEWTRKDPDNPDAWDALRAGYTELRQFEDARSAAKKAVQLAPDDAKHWRQLAEVNVEIDDPEASLNAFEQAAARNSADVDSLHSIALLQTRLNRPQEAKAAFDRAAAASPGDPVTACLRTAVAQMPPTRDGYTMARQVKSIDNRCHGRPDATAAAR
ncbi:MAG: tetratricopeptide repeat protein [Burkholderiales bacterium]